MLTLIGDGDPSEGDPRGVIGLVRGLFVPVPSGGRPRERVGGSSSREEGLPSLDKPS